MARAYNFSAGPAALPLEVLQEAQKELVDYKGTGMSVMEMSHRGKDYDAIHGEAIATFKELCGLGDDWAVCFVQGGASMQFAMIAMNFLKAGATADYGKQGTWSAKALKEAQKLAALRGASVNVAADCQKDIPTRQPSASEWKWTPGAAYSHICSNETISGAELKEFPETGSPLFCDMSSDILSCERDYSRFGMFYAGAQKNLGPSGMAVVAIRKELAEKGDDRIPTMLQYRTYVNENSLFNTPPTWGIYIFGETMKWVKKMGKENLFKLNAEKAKKIYDVIDSSEFWTGTAVKEFRSNMNVTWRIKGGDEDLEKKFVAEAGALGMSSLKGHRSVGGLRASIYNAFPVSGVDALVGFMKDFEKRNG
ncbi:MAG: 3-phosphoserine/phosphohydroxythreonine transaminase [Kiritimatiellae bacterium]|nr:3-phosphoserine/phosphohydroxythreonine transaminase [Kiritimatiellia bacterium]